MVEGSRKALEMFSMSGAFGEGLTGLPGKNEFGGNFVLRDSLGHPGRVLLEGAGNVQRVSCFLARDSRDSLGKMNLSGAFW
jgi:hypothetical protein